MKFRIFLFLAFVFILNTFLVAQAPIGYYSGTNGITGEELRDALHKSIRDHHRRSYSQIWNDFELTDIKTNGKVWDMYSDIPYPGTPPYEYDFFQDQCGTNGPGEGYCYNREHSMPSSWWGGGSSSIDTMYTDLFHLIPADAYVNSTRNNWPYGEVNSPSRVTENGGKLGPNTYSFPDGYIGTSFEPIDAYKGDLARNYFYMITRYKHRISSWNSPMLQGDGLAPWALSMLLKWHRQDPVSQKEIDRNNAIFAIQGNRNPFIDHPGFADLIWDSNYDISPIITDKRNAPLLPGASDEVRISAFVMDDEDVISSVIAWGTTPETLTNLISMQEIQNNIFYSIGSIPAMPEGTKVYYRIIAEDNNQNLSISDIASYEVGLTFDGGMETFSNHSASSSIYNNGSFLGDNGMIWRYNQMRSEGDYPIDGKGLMLRNGAQSRLISPALPHGIKDFSIQMRKAFTSADFRQLELLINGEHIGFSQIFGTQWGEDDTIHTFEFNNIEIPGDVTIEVKISGSDDINRQIVIDNLSWTSYIPELRLSSHMLSAFPLTPAGSFSSPKTYSVKTRDVHQPLQIKASEHFQISENGQSYGSQLFIFPQPGIFEKTIFVRFNPSADGQFSGSIRHLIQGVALDSIFVSGQGGGFVSLSDGQNTHQLQVLYSNRAIHLVMPLQDYASKKFALYSLNGQEILASELFEGNQIYLQNQLPAGIYFVRLWLDQKTFTAKFIIL